MMNIRLTVALVVLLCAAGCRPKADDPAREAGGARLLVDHATALSFRNHVRTTPDPAGGPGTVLMSDSESRSEHQMVFQQKAGFFLVPREHSGAVVARVYVRQERRVRVALVAGDRLKSYYLQVPEEGRWCDLVLPLTHVASKIPAGGKIDDITLWQLPPEGSKEMKPGAEFYLERLSFRP